MTKGGKKDPPPAPESSDRERIAFDAIIELEHMGLPFDRTPEGKIEQRRFGGHTANFGEKPVMRACKAADRTGHMILQTLYQQCIKNKVNFFDEYQVLDLLIEDGSNLRLIEMKSAQTVAPDALVALDRAQDLHADAYVGECKMK